MAKNDEKYYSFTINEDAQEMIEYVLDLANGRDPNPTMRYMSQLEKTKIDAFVSMLKDDKNLLYEIEAAINSNQPLIKNMPEGKADFLRSTGIFIVTEMDPHEMENPTLETLNDDPKNEEPNIPENDDERDLNNSPLEQDKNEKETTHDSSTDDIDEDTVNNISPDKIEEVQNSEKYLAFTKERLIEQAKNLPLPSDVKERIVSAYDRQVYISALQDPDFLKNFLENDEDAKKRGIDPSSFGNMHKNILMNTYVGYVAENNAEVADDGSKVAVIEFPQTIDNMPQELKNMVGDDILYYMKYAIDRVINSSNAYDAMIALIPIDNMYEEALDRTERVYDLEQGGNSNLKRAYLKYIATDAKYNLKEEFRTGRQSLDVQVNSADLDWSNPRARKEMIALVNRADKEAYNQNIESLIKNVSFDIVVYSNSDVDKLQEICEDMKDLKVKKDITVIVATNDPAISSAVDGIIARDNEINRNEVKEQEMRFGRALTTAIETGTRMALGANINVQVGVEELKNIANNTELTKEEKMDIIMDDALKNEKLMEEIAMRGDNPVEYMADLTREMLEYDDVDGPTREYDDSNAN